MDWPKILKRLYSVDADEALKRYIGILIRKKPDSTIVLFGSRARGTNLPYSDYDIAIILRKTVNKLLDVMEAYKDKPSEFAADVIVLEEEELKDPLVRKMLEGCIILYDGLKIKDILPCKTMRPVNESDP